MKAGTNKKYDKEKWKMVFWTMFKNPRRAGVTGLFLIFGLALIIKNTPKDFMDIIPSLIAILIFLPLLTARVEINFNKRMILFTQFSRKKYLFNKEEFRFEDIENFSYEVLPKGYYRLMMHTKDYSEELTKFSDITELTDTLDILIAWTGIPLRKNRYKTKG